MLCKKIRQQLPPIYCAEFQCNEAPLFPLIPPRHSSGLAAAFYCPPPVPECYRGSRQAGRQTDNGVVQRASSTLFQKAVADHSQNGCAPCRRISPRTAKQQQSGDAAYEFSCSTTNGFENSYGLKKKRNSNSAPSNAFPEMQ